MTEYIYPDGTKSRHKPMDGQIFTLWDLNQNPKSIWQWDGFAETWFDVTNPGRPTPLAKEMNAKIQPLLAKKCECGAEKCGSNAHSNWCPKHES